MKSTAAAVAFLVGSSAASSASPSFAQIARRPRPLALAAQSSSSSALALGGRSVSDHHAGPGGRSSGETALFGDTKCPCIGFDNIQGETTVEFEDRVQAAYPADLGARCEAWDNGLHPACKEGSTPGIGEGWCAQQWCFVDACNCDIPVMPKLSEYVPDARFRGKPLFYSYATCGGEDMWSKELPAVGAPGCRCIGFDNIPGTTEVTIKGDGDLPARAVAYPAELGGTCEAWDRQTHPECRRGKKSPKWCTQRWCYVDPCSCSQKEVPKVTMYLPSATFTGKSLYYSYETCGSKDHFTEKYNTEACVNQESEDDCLALKVKSGATKCAWTGSKCVGWEIMEHPLCKKVVKQDDDKGPEKSRAGAPATLARLAAATVFAAAAGSLGFSSSFLGL